MGISEVEVFCSYLHPLGVACQEVQDEVTQGWVQTQGLQLNKELGGDYGVEF